MKVCKICNIEKPLENFSFHQKSKNTRRPECRECYNRLRREKGDPDGKRKEVNRDSYKRHKEKRIKKVLEYQKENKQKSYQWHRISLRKRLDKFEEWKKTLKCEKCGENHICCLEFHHVNPFEKEYLISKIRWSRKKLEAELKKCIVLCSNCHRKLHHEEKLRYVQQQEDEIIRHTCKEGTEK